MSLIAPLSSLVGRGGWPSLLVAQVNLFLSVCRDIRLLISLPWCSSWRSTLWSSTNIYVVWKSLTESDGRKKHTHKITSIQRTQSCFLPLPRLARIIASSVRLMCGLSRALPPVVAEREEMKGRKYKLWNQRVMHRLEGLRHCGREEEEKMKRGRTRKKKKKEIRLSRVTLCPSRCIECSFILLFVFLFLVWG